MPLDLSQPETITRLQGDHVLVRRARFPDRIFQFRNVISEGRGELHLVYRAKNQKTVDWIVRQSLVDALQPVEGQEHYRWEVDVE